MVSLPGCRAQAPRKPGRNLLRRTPVAKPFPIPQRLELKNPFHKEDQAALTKTRHDDMGGMMYRF